MSLNLPDPLALPGGGRALTSTQWNEVCRPALSALIQREEYGQIPSAPGQLRATVVRTDRNALDGCGTLREIDIDTTSPDAHIELLLITPNAATTPAGCFLGLNFGGNHRILPDAAIRPQLAKRVSGADVEAERGTETGTWPAAAIIARGYALATFFNGDAVPDDKYTAAQRLAGFLPPGVEPDGGDAPATIACWAWSLSRAIDFLSNDGAVDAKRIALAGHSRNGKTALLAGAMDPRAALVISSQSGCGGAGPSRDLGNEWSQRETVQQINTAFPHWFCANFKQYNASPDKLPFDQHALIALCAPRPVLVSSATEDLWANPAGSFAMLNAADPVYRLVSGEGIDVHEMPETGVLLKTRLGHFIRPGRHAMTTEDWSAWLDYADAWL
ncbi:MAG: hypothetical protein P4L33_03560 [Capsulimonadaceae bacterium]|nr:hypothetical protein [Capsulimonadaceae bacterium]